MATQTVSTGVSLPTKYGGLGVSGKTAKPPLTAVFGALCGSKGQGKSYLIQSCPDSFVFNFDNSEVCVPPHLAHAVMWPFVDDTGKAVDGNGQPVNMTFVAALAKLRILTDLAKNNQPRPRVVFIDSVTSFIQLIFRHYYPVDDIQKIGDDANPKANMDAWRHTYAAAQAFVDALRGHGYSVWFVLHGDFTTKTYLKQTADTRSFSGRLKEGDEIQVDVYQLNVRPKFYEQFFHELNFVGRVEKRRTEKLVPFTETLTVAGKVIQKQSSRLETVNQHVVITDDHLLPRDVKHRAGPHLPREITVDPAKGWLSLEEAYREALDKRDASASS